jgi:hypothetical protein
LFRTAMRTAIPAMAHSIGIARICMMSDNCIHRSYYRVYI